MMNVRSLHIIIFIMAALFVLGLSATPPETLPSQSSSTSPVRSAFRKGLGSGQLSDKDVAQGAQAAEGSGRASVVTLPDNTVKAVGDSHDEEVASLVKTDPVSRYSSKLALVSSLFFILSLGREVLKLRGLSITRRLQLVQEDFEQEFVSSWPKAFGLAAKRVFTAKRSEAKLVRLATMLSGLTVAWAAIQNS